MIKLSKHMTDEMEERGILFSYIEAALTTPVRVAQMRPTRVKAMIRTNYDPEASSMSHSARRACVPTPVRRSPGVFLELDSNRNPIGIEVISVRRRSGERMPGRAHRWRQ